MASYLGQCATAAMLTAQLEQRDLVAKRVKNLEDDSEFEIPEHTRHLSSTEGVLAVFVKYGAGWSSSKRSVVLSTVSPWTQGFQLIPPPPRTRHTLTLVFAEWSLKPFSAHHGPRSLMSDTLRCVCHHSGIHTPLQHFCSSVFEYFPSWNQVTTILPDCEFCAVFDLRLNWGGLEMLRCVCYDPAQNNESVSSLTNKRLKHSSFHADVCKLD